MSPKSMQFLITLFQCETFDDFIEQRMREKVKEWYHLCDCSTWTEEDREYYRKLKPQLKNVYNFMSPPDDQLEE